MALCSATLPASAFECSLAPSGLVHWWRGENNAQDSAGSAEGALTPGASFVNGRVGRGFLFNGASGAVQFPDSASWNFAKRDFSIDLWVRFGAIAPRSPFISSDDGGGDRKKWVFWYDALGDGGPPGPALRFALNAPRVGNSNPISAPWSPTVGVWYHVAITRASDTYSLFINGAKVATANDVATVPDASFPLEIGAAEGFRHNGVIDEVDIFDRALSPSEIRAIFLSRSAGKCPIVGGTHKGILPTANTVVCLNTNTGERVQFKMPDGATSWDCGAAGLHIRRGDAIDMFMRVKGSAD